MFTYVDGLLKYKDASGQWHEADVIKGESAYQAAVRLGIFSGTESEYYNKITNDRDGALSQINAKLTEVLSAIDTKKQQALADIPDDYTTLSNDVSDLKSATNYLYNKSNPDEYGIITYLTEWGYPTLSDGSYTWATNRNFISTKRTDPVKVKSGDIIHLMDAKAYAYFAIYSADGVTWENLTTTTSAVNTIIPNDGYVFVTVRKNPSAAMTDEEFASIFDHIAIFRRGYTNKTMELSKGVETAINMGTGVEVLCNEEWYTWQWVTAHETELIVTGKDLIGGGTFSVSTGDKFKVWGNFWTEFSSDFSSIGVMVRERNSSGTSINTRSFFDFSSPQEFTITDARTAIIELSPIAISPSLAKGYNANFYYHVVLCRVNESSALDDVLTEAGDTWEV